MISCKDYYEKKKDELKEQISEIEKKPKLCVIQFGNDESTNSYIREKKKDCENVGILFNHICFENYENINEDYVISLIEKLNNDDFVDGIIIERPIPQKYNIENLKECISPQKDVDGLNRNSKFTPCTPKGIIDYLKYNNYKFIGKTACIIGRSDTVGKPLADLLLKENSTIITCHSYTTRFELMKLLRLSHIVFTCIDKIEYFDNIFLSYQDVIDFGLGRGEDGKLHGNIQQYIVDILKRRNHKFTISGVGGTGLLTRIALLENLIQSSSNKIMLAH